MLIWAVLLKWYDGARGNEAVGGRTHNGGVLQCLCTARSVHAGSLHHLPAAGACAPSSPDRKEHSLTVPYCHASLLVTASANEDVNCCVTRRQRGTLCVWGTEQPHLYPPQGISGQCRNAVLVLFGCLCFQFS